MLLIRITRQQASFRRLGLLALTQKALFYYVLLFHLRNLWRDVYSKGPLTSLKDLYRSIARYAFTLLLKLPSFKRKVSTELSKARIEMQEKIAPDLGPDLPKHLTLPDKGRDKHALLEELSKLENLKASNWQQGRVSGAVYLGNEGDTPEVMKEAMMKFILANPLHPDVFPGVRKMEAEIVQMTLDLFNAPAGAAGTTTSGGTESIIMACKAYRDWARETKGITQPEMVVPVSGHAAFEKAGAYLNIKLRVIPVDKESRRVNLKAMKRAINSNTICLVGSCPNFPDGACDDIEALSTLALKYKVGLHVDCCLGSFLVPFIEQAGFQFQPFDFRLPGVTSISCDVHKYGFTNKGMSTILYRTQGLRRHQYFVTTTWPGGTYASPSMAGSRPGALIAGAWATMMSIGKDGYLESCKQIVGAAKRIEQELTREVPEVFVLGKPLVSVVAFGSEVVNILEVGDRLSKKGWHLNALQNPPALHIAVTRLTVDHVDELITDVKETVQDVLYYPGDSKGTNTTIYGLGNSSPAGPGLVKEVAAMFIDTLYHV